MGPRNDTRHWPIDSVVRDARAGDAEAIALLVAQSHPYVHRFARSLCASREDAEDAAQEALVVLYQRIGSLRATSALAAWMFQIVRNECIRRSRTLLRSPQSTPAPRVRSAEDAVMTRLEAERIARAIAALPQDQREVLILRDVQDRSGADVAKALNITRAAMKSRLHRARAAIRELAV